MAAFRGDDMVVPGNSPDANVKMSNLDNEPMVKMYFINYLVVDHNPESSRYGQVDHPVLSHVDGRVYNIPKIGESLEVRRRVAEDLDVRLRIFDPVMGTAPGFTTDPNIAASVKLAFESGKLSDLGTKQKNAQTVMTFKDIVAQTTREQAVQEMSTEELEAILAERKGLKTDAAEEESGSSPKTKTTKNSK